MRLLKSEHFNKFLQKLIFCVMGALVLAGIAEVVCNFETISNHKFNIDISDKLERREDSWYIEYKFDKPVYVDKLSLTGEFKKDTSYTIDLSTRNEFGKKEKVTIKSNTKTF